jgi:hypothetical protein
MRTRASTPSRRHARLSNVSDHSDPPSLPDKPAPKHVDCRDQCGVGLIPNRV